jgi:hypothetical protein
MPSLGDWEYSNDRAATLPLLKRELFSVGDLEGHLVRLIALVAEAIERGAHHYVRFIGD